MGLFDAVIDRVLGHEGGFTADPNDRGNWTGGKVGEGSLNGTKWGISAAAFPELDIENLSRTDAKDIYRKRYWDIVGGVSDAVRFQVLDAAVNHGVHRAIELLQKAVSVKADGAWGPHSIAAASAMDNDDILLRFNAYRDLFITDIKTFDRYGRGWMRRTAQNLLYAAEDN